MADYAYPNRPAAQTNAKLLRSQIEALNLPGWTDFTRDTDGILRIPFPTDLTRTQKTALDAVIANHDPTQLTVAQQAEMEKAAIEQERLLRLDALKTKIETGTPLDPTELTEAAGILLRANMPPARSQSGGHKP